ncbi:hypothetical protein Ddc_11291 [Ditylenchus destructor]|nr:hypothetical protein Ddc_11291 [Ditylenchus destructor]
MQSRRRLITITRAPTPNAPQIGYKWNHNVKRWTGWPAPRLSAESQSREGPPRSKDTKSSQERELMANLLVCCCPPFPLIYYFERARCGGCRWGREPRKSGEMGLMNGLWGTGGCMESCRAAGERTPTPQPLCMLLRNAKAAPCGTERVESLKTINNNP